MPVINFNGVNKVMFANSEISKVYCGSQLVWEKKEREESYREIYTSHLTKEIILSNQRIEFAIDGQKVIKIDDVVKVVIGGRVTIPRSDIHSIYKISGNTTIISLKQNSGYSGAFYVFESIEIYLK